MVHTIGARFDTNRINNKAYCKLFDDLQSITLCLRDLRQRPKDPELFRLVRERFPTHRLYCQSIFDKRSGISFSSVNELTSYTKEIVTAYDVIDDWEPINEILHAGRLDLRICSDPNWPIYACETVRNLRPKARITYNEYALKDKEYWRGVLDLSKKLRDAGVIDAVGIQRHIDLRGKLKTPVAARAFDYGTAFLLSNLPKRRLITELKNIKNLGLAASFTEVSIKAFLSQVQTQKALYRDLIMIAKKQDIDLTFWHLCNPKAEDGNPGVKELNLI